MTQVVSDQTHTLTNSLKLTRPHTCAFFRPDTNIGQTDITAAKNKKFLHSLHVPTLTGAPDYTIECCDSNESNVDHSFTPTNKKKVDIKILDPLTGFISSAGEVLINNRQNNGQMISMGKSKKEPQQLSPENNHSIRIQPESIDELK
jgi:hypothetical protein